MDATENRVEQTGPDQQSEIEGLQAQLRDKHDMYMRALADFQNYRQRVDRDRGSAAASGKRQIILPLLEVLDGFDRALHQMSKSPSPVSEGMQAIHRNLLSLLEAQGVTPFSSVGEAFNPQRHEAIASVAGDERERGTVVDEVQRGYRWGDEVLRPARVRVAQ
jgi:molecular chaperone GrpE